MKKNEQELLDQFKAEADRELFDNLHFDFRMKEQVMQTIKSEQKRVFWKDWFQTRRKKWALGAMTMTAAVITSLFIINMPDAQQDILLPPEEVGSVMIDTTDTPVNQPLNSSDNIPHVTTMIDDGSEVDGLEVWTLQDLTEAEAWFGDELLIPSYTTAPFVLDDVEAMGSKEGIANQISIRYVSEELSFQVIQRKQESPDKISDDDTIDIHGVTGFVKQTKKEQTQIVWFVNYIQYTVTGNINEHEAVKVAQSLQ